MVKYNIFCGCYPDDEPVTGYEVIIAPSLGDKDRTALTDNPDIKRVLSLLVSGTFSGTYTSVDRYRLPLVELTVKRGAKGDADAAARRIIRSVGGRLADALDSVGSSVHLDLCIGEESTNESRVS